MERSAARGCKQRGVTAPFFLMFHWDGDVPIHPDTALE